MMGVEHNHAVIATTWNSESYQAVVLWVKEFEDPEQVSDHCFKHLFVGVNSKVNNKHTVILTPDGSKEGWDVSNDGDRLREAFIAKLKETGNWEWVEVGYGELGVKIYRSSEDHG
jgi:hypothetical protein